MHYDTALIYNVGSVPLATDAFKPGMIYDPFGLFPAWNRWQEPYNRAEGALARLLCVNPDDLLRAGQRVANSDLSVDQAITLYDITTTQEKPAMLFLPLPEETAAYQLVLDGLAIAAAHLCNLLTAFMGAPAMAVYGKVERALAYDRGASAGFAATMAVMAVLVDQGIWFDWYRHQDDMGLHYTVPCIKMRLCSHTAEWGHADNVWWFEYPAVYSTPTPVPLWLAIQLGLAYRRSDTVLVAILRHEATRIGTVVKAHAPGYAKLEPYEAELLAQYR